MSDHYQEMISRNWAFVSPEQQESIRTARVLVAGCGLGSVIAAQAVRTGFTRLAIADGDVVERSNLNRQHFVEADIGANKALALARHLRSINPEVELDVLERRIGPEDTDRLVAGVNVVVNTVDFDETAWALNRSARAAGVPVLFPMNMAWGGFCLAFLPDSPGLERLIGPTPPPDDAEFLGRLFSNLEGFELPRYLRERLAELPEIVASNSLPAPQTGIAAARSASLVAEAALRLVVGLPVRSSPKAICLDGWSMWED